MTSRCTRNPTGEKYVPIDELLAMPRVRILRYLRHCDWVGSIDIYIALDIGDHNVGTYNQTLSRISRQKLVDRTGAQVHGYRYRINDAGRIHYDQLIARSQKLPPISERELERADIDDLITLGAA